MDWVRVELTSNSLQDCRFAELSYQPIFRSDGCGRSRTASLSLMRRLLCQLSYAAPFTFWEPTEESNLDAFSARRLKVRFRRPMPGSRAVSSEV